MVTGQFQQVFGHFGSGLYNPLRPVPAFSLAHPVATAHRLNSLFVI
jgi:hypothetical protein